VPDPWLAPRLRAELGLPSLERRIGLAAHDFALALGAPRVLVTRARRDARAPAIASRFWLRLEAMTGGLTRAPALRKWAQAIDKPAGMIVHAGAGVHSGTLVNALLHRFGALSGVGGALRPGIEGRPDHCPARGFSFGGGQTPFASFHCRGMERCERSLTPNQPFYCASRNARISRATSAAFEMNT